ncbi:MAG TPA: PCI domain-containing protein, partial [Candidatus Deferrimicrobium sp.]|nr:PCI domain-containing protein [Candidatus Deferrimicrobium sp.]
MSSVRETCERNVEGLNDLFMKHQNEIRNAIQELIDSKNYEDALLLLDDKIASAILEFEKRKKDVTAILETKLKLSFDDKNKGALSDWNNAVINVKSKIEMFENGLREQINDKLTENVRIPAIEKFLLDAAKHKTFTRINFDFVANRLKVPSKKVEEIAENLVFDGKLPARIDVVSGTIIFAEDPKQVEASQPVVDIKAPSIPPPPKPPPVPRLSSSAKESQPIKEDSATSQMPQTIDLSLEAPESGLDISGISPDDVSLPPTTGLDDMETINLAMEILTPTPEPPETKQETSKEEVDVVPIEKQPPEIKGDVSQIKPEPPAQKAETDDEEKEALGLISFFKSSVQELSEQEKEEARQKREEKKRKLEEEKRRKLEEQKEVKKEETKPPESSFRAAVDLLEEDKLPSIKPPEAKPFRTAGDILNLKGNEVKPPVSTKPVSELLIPAEPKLIQPKEKSATSKSPAKRVTC